MGVGAVNICRHCGAAIVEFTFSDGKQWWHFGATPHLYCIGNSGAVATP